jgi:cell division septation protein DedD
MGPDFPPEARQLAFLCALLTVFFVGFFTTGLFLGHRQIDPATLAASANLTENFAEARPVEPAASHSTGVPAENLAAAPAMEKAFDPSSSSLHPALNPPVIPDGVIVVQVAALLSHAEALTLVDSLRAKHFAAYVLSSDSDKFNRVQVGPYTDSASARIASKQLEDLGYQPYLRRR